MIVHQASLQMALNAVVGPDAGTNGGFASGGLSLSAAIAEQFPAASKVLAARMFMGGSGATGQVTFNPAAGAGLTCATGGTKQVEIATVTAAAGATSSGNLVVTLTGAALTGSPVTINVALTPAANPTAASIAASIVAALNAHTASAFPTYYLASNLGNAIYLTSVYPQANDATLNLAIAAGLGVSAAASSSNSVGGVAGSIIDLPAADTYDAVGSPLLTFSTVDALLLRVSGLHSVSGYPDAGSTPLPPVKPGKALLWQADAASPIIAFRTAGYSMADLLVIGH